MKSWAGLVAFSGMLITSAATNAQTAAPRPYVVDSHRVVLGPLFYDKFVIIRLKPTNDVVTLDVHESELGDFNPRHDLIYLTTDCSGQAYTTDDSPARTAYVDKARRNFIYPGPTQKVINTKSFRGTRGCEQTSGAVAAYPVLTAPIAAQGLTPPFAVAWRIPDQPTPTVVDSAGKFVGSVVKDDGVDFKLGGVLVGAAVYPDHLGDKMEITKYFTTTDCTGPAYLHPSFLFLPNAYLSSDPTKLIYPADSGAASVTSFKDSSGKCVTFTAPLEAYPLRSVGLAELGFKPPFSAKLQ